MVTAIVRDAGKRELAREDTAPIESRQVVVAHPKPLRGHGQGCSPFFGGAGSILGSGIAAISLGLVGLTGSRNDSGAISVLPP